MDDLSGIGRGVARLRPGSAIADLAIAPIPAAISSSWQRRAQ